MFLHMRGGVAGLGWFVDHIGYQFKLDFPAGQCTSVADMSLHTRLSVGHSVSTC